MLKGREISIGKLALPTQNLFLFALAIALMAVISHKAWQEYQIYQMNETIKNHPTSAGSPSELVITWEDYAINEEGYQVERRPETEVEYEVIGNIAVNSTSYTDSSTLQEGEYCYRVVAFNQAGRANSDDACVWVSNLINDPAQPKPVTITSAFVRRPGKIELDGREFYSFKSNYPYNEAFSVDEVSDLEFTINKGRLNFRDAKAFVFKERGEILDTGFARLRFNDLNSFSFSLHSYGEPQVATLYLAFGAWGDEEGEPALNVKAGDTTHLITLPSRDSWHFVAIDIAFDQYTPVSITAIDRPKGKGAIKVAGVILNKANQSDW